MSGSQHAKMSTGGAEPLAKEQQMGACGNLLSAGAEAQADSCGGPCLRKSQEKLNLLEMAFLRSPGLSHDAALLSAAVIKLVFAVSSPFQGRSMHGKLSQR